MIVSINQPAYLPWPGYFHRIAAADLHVVLDHVQFEKNSFTNRNKVRTKDGWTWLTVPVRTKGRFGHLSINDLEISDELTWMAKHWQTLRQNYAKARFFPPHAPFFEGIYQDRGRWTRLVDLLDVTTSYLLKAFGIRTPLRRSSQMQIAGGKDELVIDICLAAGATVYLSGPLGRDYLDVSKFRRAGIEVRFDDYRSPLYEQVYPGFEPYMSAVDLLFNRGPESLRVIMEGQEKVHG